MKELDYELWIRTNGYSHLSEEQWDWLIDNFKELNEVPSVQPEQKTGRWIYTNTIGGMRYYGCAICANQEKDCIADEHEIQWYNYCPYCGAKMEK